jgi:hypothetical protein
MSGRKKRSKTPGTERTSGIATSVARASSTRPGEILLEHGIILQVRVTISVHVPLAARQTWNPSPAILGPTAIGESPDDVKKKVKTEAEGFEPPTRFPV